MALCDFVVKYDPSKDTPYDLTLRILHSLIVRRIKYKKPVVMFVGGDSGEGKSESCLKLQEILLNIQGIDLLDYVNDINVYFPTEYPEKLNGLLYDTRLKPINLICLHEARILINSKQWQNFTSQAVSHVNAMSRSIKRLVIMIISQFIRDITTDIRYTLTYYCKVYRPMGGNRRARLFIYRMWKDDRDMEKPKLKKRRITGYIVMPNGVRRKFTPKYLEMTRTSKEIIKIFEKNDTEAKARILTQKMNKMVKDMSAEFDLHNVKVDKMLDYYTSNLDLLNRIGKRRGKKWKLNKDFQTMHDLTKEETKLFEVDLNARLVKEGVI